MKKSRFYQAKAFPAFAILILVIFDQASKYLVRRFITENASLDLGIFAVTNVRNTGISFGMLKGFNSVFTAVSFLALLFFLYLLQKKKNFVPQLALICAGISGNLIDRLTLGYVVDFIDFRFWPIFNFADSCISIGVAWLLIASLKSDEELF